MATDPVTAATTAYNSAVAALEAARQQAAAATSVLDGLQSQLQSGDTSVTGAQLTAARGDVDAAALVLAGAEDAANQGAASLKVAQQQQLAGTFASWAQTSAQALPGLLDQVSTAASAFVQAVAAYNAQLSEYYAQASAIGDLPGVIAVQRYGPPRVAGLGSPPPQPFDPVASLLGVIADCAQGYVGSQVIIELRREASNGNTVPTGGQ